MTLETRKSFLRYDRKSARIRKISSFLFRDSNFWMILMTKQIFYYATNFADI